MWKGTAPTLKAKPASTMPMPVSSTGPPAEPEATARAMPSSLVVPVAP